MSNSLPKNVDMVGKFVNRYLWSDVQVVGKIIDTFGKTGIVIEPYAATLDKNWKADVIPGGFAGHCVNNYSQTYDYAPSGDENIRMRISQKFFKMYRIEQEPNHFYDYNF